MSRKPINVRPVSTHVRESNALQPHLCMLGNLMLLSLTLTLGRKPLTLTSDPTLKRRQSLFCLMFLVSFSLTHKSNVFQTLIFSRQGIQCILDPYLITSMNPFYFRPSFIHPLNPMLQTLTFTLTLTLGHNPLTLTPITYNSYPSLLNTSTQHFLALLLSSKFANTNPMSHLFLCSLSITQYAFLIYQLVSALRW